MQKLPFAAAAIVTALGALPAGAADLSTWMPVKAPPMVAYSPWTGFYAGLNGGYAFGGSAAAIVIPASLFPPGSPIIPGATTPPSALATKPSGWLGGGQVGYNMQIGGGLVAGIEADIQYSGIKDKSATAFTAAVDAIVAVVGVSGTATLTEKLDYFGTLRGRLGYLVSPNVLPYITGGLAWGRSEVALTSTVTGGGLTTVTTALSEKTRLGYALGAGVEWAWSDAWTMRGEYLFLHLDQKVALAVPAAVATSDHLNAHIARIALNYRFR